MLPLCQASPRRGHSPTPNPSPTALQESGACRPHGRLLEPHRLVPRLAERLDAQLSGGRLASGAARVLWADDVGVARHEEGVGDANALGGRGAWEVARPGHRDAARRAMVLSPSCCARIQVSNLWLPTQRIFTAVCTSRSTDQFAQCSPSVSLCRNAQVQPTAGRACRRRGAPPQYSTQPTIGLRSVEVTRGLVPGAALARPRL